MKLDSFCPARSTRPAVRFTTWVVILVVGCLVAAAHDSPEHIVEALTERMTSAGETPDLLLQRAVEYRALKNSAAAEKDLQAVLRRDPKHLPALTELARLFVEQRKGDAALQMINRALSGSRTPMGDAPELLILRAQTYFEMGRAEQALADCACAFAQGNPQLDWYLLRSQIQTATGQKSERVRDLALGWELTGSAVLKTEWIDALIDAGKTQLALEHIEPELAESRWQSSWLLRRARARLATGEVADARKDLHAAIDEINQRLRPVRPDLTLLADRGTAFALLGDHISAEADLKKLRQLRSEEWVVRPLVSALRQLGANSGEPAIQKKFYEN